jgi:indolepyruvate ferredoxin oxidoreductase
MGAEGVPWTAIATSPTKSTASSILATAPSSIPAILAIRQSVAAGANITYKILVNDAVAMTGGQPIDGELTPEQITHQMHDERVARIVLMSDHPTPIAPPTWPPAPKSATATPSTR